MVFVFLARPRRLLRCFSIGALTPWMLTGLPARGHPQFFLLARRPTTLTGTPKTEAGPEVKVEMPIFNSAGLS
jgi:hypothetical protein